MRTLKRELCLLLTILGCAGAAVAAPPQPLAGLSANIADYGADPTGVRDSAEAFTRIMERAGACRHIQILIPPGKFRLNRRVLFKARNNETFYGLHVQGAGVNVSELLVDNTEGGLAFAGTLIAQLSVTVSDLALVAGRDAAGTALAFDTANAGVQNDRQFMARNLMIRGERFDRGYFRIGVHVRNAWYALLENVNITQQYQTDVGQRRYSTEYNMLLEDCYSPSVIDCRALNGKYGLVQRAVKTEPEDGIVRGSYFVGQVESIVLDIKSDTSKWPEPGLHIDNCHINYRDYGIRLQGVQQANISHNLFYCHDRTGTRWHKDNQFPMPDGDEHTPRAFEPRDIDVAYGSNILIDGNIFTEPANSHRVAVRIGPDAGHILVSGNQFNLAGTAIKNEAKEPSYATGNIFGGKPDWSHAKRDWSGPLTPYVDRPGTLVIKDFK